MITKFRQKWQTKKAGGAVLVYKVVFHIDETTKVGLGLKNIENLLIDLGADNVEVELVVNAEAITMLAANNNENASRIADLAAKGAKFAACANAMKAFTLTKEEMLPQAIVVPSGAGELTKKQHDGFGYIRP
jgi:intracellular sulfur oxidation DsrE/DsrF family protein